MPARSAAVSASGSSTPDMCWTVLALRFRVLVPERYHRSSTMASGGSRSRLKSETDFSDGREIKRLVCQDRASFPSEASAAHSLQQVLRPPFEAAVVVS